MYLIIQEDDIEVQVNEISDIIKRMSRDGYLDVIIFEDGEFKRMVFNEELKSEVRAIKEMELDD